MNHIILYSTHSSQRLIYVFDFIFQEILGVNIIVTQSEADFLSSTLFKINYSNKPLAAEMQIIPSGLLFENEIVEKDISIAYWKELPVFFHTPHQEIPFDIFSAVFYLLSRYEEYLPYEPDEYLRFPHKKSIAYQHGFLHLPLVDLWLHEFKNCLSAKNDSFVFKKQEFEFFPTYDIDIAYSYKGKSAIRNLGGALKDMMSGNVAELINRFKVIFFNRQDPYDAFQWLDEIHANYKLKPIYFFLLSQGGPMDKNISPDSSCMKTLMSEIKQKYQVGIHPSWQSHESLSMLESEMNRMPTVTKSRQHYIRFTLPETYRNLINIGLEEDYSMGYGSINGFRASTSNDFFWFDLLANEKTSLRLFPFCFMECNSFFEQKMNSIETFEELKHYIKVIKQINGKMITIWHNFSLGTDTLWSGWKELYLNFIKEMNANKI